MLDTLDLGLLKTQIMHQRKAARRTWIMCLVVFIGFIAIMMLLARAPSSSNQTTKSCLKCSAVIIQLLIAIFPSVVLITAGIAAYINLRRRKKIAKAVRQDLQKLDLPPAIKS